jgi:D-lactate dehydrogenase (cytochrome)
MATRIRLNGSAMRGLRRPVSSRSPVIMGRQYQRYNSTNDTGYINQPPFWTTNKVLLLSAFTGALAYTYGLWDAGASYKKEGVNTSQKPVYAKKAEWEKVSSYLWHI